MLWAERGRRRAAQDEHGRKNGRATRLRAGGNLRHGISGEWARTIHDIIGAASRHRCTTSVTAAVLALLAATVALARGAAVAQGGIDAKQEAAAQAAVSRRHGILAQRRRSAAFQGASPATPRSGRRRCSACAFWTTELEPFERAYDGPIKILVGMDTKGVLTGVIVTEHHEPYGNFSVDRPELCRRSSAARTSATRSRSARTSTPSRGPRSA